MELPSIIICHLVLSREVLVSATDSSTSDMLACREGTKTVARATKDRARILTSASLVGFGVSGTSGHFASPVLPIALECFR